MIQAAIVLFIGFFVFALAASKQLVDIVFSHLTILLMSIQRSLHVQIYGSQDIWYVCSQKIISYACLLCWFHLILYFDAWAHLLLCPLAQHRLDLCSQFLRVVEVGVWVILIADWFFPHGLTCFFQSIVLSRPIFARAEQGCQLFKIGPARKRLAVVGGSLDTHNYTFNEYNIQLKQH